jgi:hypothetical protein
VGLLWCLRFWFIKCPLCSGINSSSSITTSAAPATTASTGEVEGSAPAKKKKGENKRNTLSQKAPKTSDIGIFYF